MRLLEPPRMVSAEDGTMVPVSGQIFFVGDRSLLWAGEKGCFDFGRGTVERHSEDKPALVHGVSSSQIWSLAQAKGVRKCLAKAFGIADSASEKKIAENMIDNLPACFDFGATAEWTVSQPGLDAWRAVPLAALPFLLFQRSHDCLISLPNLSVKSTFLSSV